MLPCPTRVAPSRDGALRWIASLGAVTAEALAVRHGVSPASARGVLTAAVRAGLLIRSRPLHGAPVLYAATSAGLRQVDAARLGPCRVTPSNAQHLVVCASMAAALEGRHPDHRVVGERELRCDEHAQGSALASARIGMAPDGGPLLHRPDLVLWPPAGGDGRPVVVEVELTIKGARRLAGICQAWARCRLVDGVLYYAPPDVARAVQRAVDQVRAADRIAVIALETGRLDAPLLRT